MRHMYFRGVLAIVWLVAAIYCGVNGNMEMAALYVVVAGIFFYSAYSTKKSGKGSKGAK